VISAIISWIFSFILRIVDWFLALILSVIGMDPNQQFMSRIVALSNGVQSLYAMMIQKFMFVRAMFDISAFEMTLIVELLSITLLYKPIVFVIKLCIKWIKNLIP